MSWSTLPPKLRELAEKKLTAKELEAIRLKASGYGRRRIALVLGISEGAVRSRLFAAEQKLVAALDELDDTPSEEEG